MPKIFKTVLFVTTLYTMKSNAQTHLPIQNPNLTVHPLMTDSWSGNPLLNGRYVNLEFQTPPRGFGDVMKWKRMKNPYEAEKKIDHFKLPISEDLRDLKSDTADGIFWLGHATFIIRINGIQIITDPVFGKATVVKRMSDLPLPIQEIPANKVLLMSHDHRDHCDKKSLQLLQKKSKDLQYFSGLNMEGLLSGLLKKGTVGQTAGWFQEFKVDSSLGFRLWFLPTRHWAKRGLYDTNKRLWGSFVIQFNSGLTIYFGGDSGYGNHYKKIAALFPRIDYAILGIGAYEPEWFMEENHSSPEKAYQAFVDLGATYFIPMHYGTFDLSDEPIGHPEKVLKEIKQREQNTGIIIPVLGANLLQKPQ